jgi:hypothetical protein
MTRASCHCLEHTSGHSGISSAHRASAAAAAKQQQLIYTRDNRVEGVHEKQKAKFRFRIETSQKTALRECTDEVKTS